MTAGASPYGLRPRGLRPLGWAGGAAPRPAPIRLGWQTAVVRRGPDPAFALIDRVSRRPAGG